MLSVYALLIIIRLRSFFMSAENKILIKQIMNLNNKKTHHYYDQIKLEVVNPIPTQSHPNLSNIS